MRRAASLFASVALASGCLLESRPPEGSVAIYWTFWSQTLGNIGASTDPATSICTKAAVRDVRITLTTPAGDMLRPSNGPCITANDVPGAAFAGLEVGTWGYYLEGRRGGVTVFDAAGTFVVHDGERTIVDEEQGARAGPPGGFWDVVASYTTAGCSAGDRLKFDLIDAATLAVTFTTDDAQVNPLVDVPCTSGTFTIPSVAPGAYVFSDWIHVDATGAPVAWGTCRPHWTQLATTSTPVSIDVTSATAPPVGNPGVCP